jgi:hypothetical protein
MADKKPVKRGKDTTQTLRGKAFLERLAESKGKPVRVDTDGVDLPLLESLVSGGYAPTMAETYRKAMREAHARFVKKKSK